MSEDIRARLYDAYSTTHAGVSDADSGALPFRRDILPHLPEDRGSVVVDLGCGQGQLVRQLLSQGYRHSSGIDISPEQVELAQRSGLGQVRQGDFREVLEAGSVDVVTATDFFEHLTRSEALEAADHVHSALRPGGRLILRVPNSVSPFSGNYRFGDLTHETSFTARSLKQLGAAADFEHVQVVACPPPIHGTKSLARSLVWKFISGGMKVALAAETGALRGHLVTQNIVAVMRKAE